MKKYNILKKNRIPNDCIYSLIITLIIAFAIIWIIYISIPYSHYNLYFNNIKK